MRRFALTLAVTLPFLAGCSGSDEPYVPAPQSSAASQAQPQPKDLEGINKDVKPMDPDEPPKFTPPRVSGDLGTPEGVCTAVSEVNSDDLVLAVAIHLELTDGTEELSTSQSTQAQDYIQSAFAESCPEFAEAGQ